MSLRCSGCARLGSARRIGCCRTVRCCTALTQSEPGWRAFGGIAIARAERDHRLRCASREVREPVPPGRDGRHRHEAEGLSAADRVRRRGRGSCRVDLPGLHVHDDAHPSRRCPRRGLEPGGLDPFLQQHVGHPPPRHLPRQLPSVDCDRRRDQQDTGRRVKNEPRPHGLPQLRRPGADALSKQRLVAAQPSESEQGFDGQQHNNRTDVACDGGPPPARHDQLRSLSTCTPTCSTTNWHQ